MRKKKRKKEEKERKRYLNILDHQLNKVVVRTLLPELSSPKFFFPCLTSHLHMTCYPSLNEALWSLLGLFAHSLSASHPHQTTCFAEVDCQNWSVKYLIFLWECLWAQTVELCWMRGGVFGSASKALHLLEASLVPCAVPYLWLYHTARTAWEDHFWGGRALFTPHRCHGVN